MFENYIGGCENLSSPHLNKEKHSIWMVKKEKRELMNTLNMQMSLNLVSEAVMRLSSLDQINISMKQMHQ